MKHTFSHQARKRFGQNFLQDPSIIQQIIHCIHPQANETIVEIGPGLGALTEPLLARVDSLYVVELDRDLARNLAAKFPKKLHIFQEDALKFDFARLPAPRKIVGNLPYNISTPLLFHLTHFSETTTEMIFMLQKEVVLRMIAAPNSSEYGRLSVMLQYFFDMELLMHVPPEAFYPQPKVDSAIVRLVPKMDKAIAKDFDLFEKIVASAFSQRRKTLKNTLKPFLEDSAFEALNLDPRARAEQLALKDYLAISNWLSNSPASA